eukprot:gb/GFBE01072374.1/.p1 GENE.gb/GFBE01072374.1/~~gb/GFBE01072374.1/.p1  ORF type:complete len:378 (+),score=102.82 gb/GFBE01072374.1/:1-1134(+)
MMFKALQALGFLLAARADEQQLAGSLAGDDECAAGNGEDGCSLNALQLAQRYKESLDEDVEANLTGELGMVYAIYTYGACGTAKKPLPNLASPDHNFLGLRTYTETINTAGSRSSDVGAIFDGLMHARIPTLALHWKKDSEYYPGAGRPDLPKHGDKGRVADISLHNMKNYMDRFSGLQLSGDTQALKSSPRFEYALKFAWVAWGAYEWQTLWQTKEKISMEGIINRFLPQWRLVAQTQQNTLEAIDNIWVVQNEDSLDCVLAFEGTHTFAEFFGNLEQANAGYCGFDEVHKGYAGKLWWLMKYSMPKLRPSLAKCAKVSCTGHSLGGALCDVFAACANSGRTGNREYRNQMFTKGTPELMPRIHQKQYTDPPAKKP